MRTYLTPHLLGFLIERGYTYCLANVKINTASNPLATVTLTPVKYDPGQVRSNGEYDSYFKITREPVQMAFGMKDTEVYVNLDLKKHRNPLCL